MRTQVLSVKTPSHQREGLRVMRRWCKGRLIIDSIALRGGTSIDTLETKALVDIIIYTPGKDQKRLTTKNSRSYQLRIDYL